MYRYLNDNLGIAMIGIWSVVLASVSSSRLIDVGFSSVVIVFISKSISQNDYKSVRESIDTITVILMGLLLFLLPVLYPFLYTILKYIFSSSDFELAAMVLPYALSSVWFIIISGISQGTIDGFQKMPLRATLVILSQLLLLISIFFLVPRYGIIGLAWAQIAQGLFLFIFGRLLAMRLVPNLKFYPFFIRFNIVKKMINYGVNVQFSMFLQLLQEPLTKGLVVSFGGSSIAGYYEIAYQIVTRVRSLIVTANNAIVPYVSSLNISSPEKMKDLYSKNLALIFIFCPIIFCILHLWSGIISSLLTNSFSSEFLFVIKILVIVYGINVFAAPAYFFNMGDGRVWHNTKHHMLTGILNIFLGALFGYYFGWKGAVIGTSLALVFGSLYLLLTHSVDGIKVSNISFLKNDLLILFSCIIFYIYGWFYPINLNLHSFFYVGLYIIIPALLFFTLIFTHPNIKVMLKKST